MEQNIEGFSIVVTSRSSDEHDKAFREVNCITIKIAKVTHKLLRKSKTFIYQFQIHGVHHKSKTHWEISTYSKICIKHYTLIANLHPVFSNKRAN